MASIEHVTALRAQLWDAGFRPVPIFNIDADVDWPGKQPLGKGWQLDARRDPPFCVTSPAVPHALNSGILCDGLRAIDIDVDDPDTARTIRAMALERFGEAPVRYRRNAPRCLVLYRAAQGEPPKAVITGDAHTPEHARKVEVLGRGQQFVAFGLHPSGAELEWFPDAPGHEMLASLPAIAEPDLYAFLRDIAPILGASQIPTLANGHDHAPGEPQADSLRIAAALAQIPNNAAPDWEWWNRTGMAVWRATGGSAAGWEAWSAWSARNPCNDPDATWKRWEHYRSSPPTQIGAGTIFHMARGEQWPPHALDEPPLEPDADAPANTPIQHTDDDYTATPFQASDLSLLRPYDWVYQRIMVSGYFCALGAPPGTGKSALIVAIAISVALGRPLLGGEPPEPGNAWIINLEDPREAILKMVWACCDYFGIDVNDLNGKLFIDSGRAKPLVVARLVDGTALRMPVADGLSRECERLRVRALFIDPVVDTHTLPENDNITMNDYCAIWNQLADQCGLAVMLSMHFRKGGQAGDPEAFRGASAIIGKARSAITLGVMSEKDAEKLNVKPELRGYHLRLDNAKRNLSPPPTAADWLRLESVELVNGDNIQAIRLWSPPSPWCGITMAQTIKALEQIDAGTGEGEFYTDSRRGRTSARWVGNVVMECAGEGSLSAYQVSAIIDQWLQTKLLIKGVYHSKRERREMPCVRVDMAKLAEMKLQSAPPPEGAWEC